jgi:hypothetical protein
MRDLLGELDSTALTLGPLGWCMTSSAMTDRYNSAARLVKEGKSDEAEAVLEESWNDGDRLRIMVGSRIKTLYDGDDPRRLHRWLALDEALKCHDAGLYRGSVCVLLTLLEGVVEDVTASNPDARFYRRGKADLLTDDSTLAGHPSSLPVLSRLMGEQQTETAATGLLRRNGILHGRELDYGTKRNSTKAFVALLAVIEWAQPLAQAQRDQVRAQREAHYAGSDEVDEDGRRLDRREFDPVKKLLHTVHQYQFGQWKRKGRYAHDASELGLRDELGQDPRLRIITSENGRRYQAWFVTVSGWVFGIAGRNGEYPAWLYSSDTQPKGPPERDEGWAHVVNDAAHSDW